MLRIEFNAPWSKGLKLTTACSAAVLGAIVLAGVSLSIPMGGRIVFIGVPLLVLLGSGLATIRGYVLTEDEIQVRRLGWTTHLPMRGLQDVAGDAEAMRGSIRLFGNGGLFAFTGIFWNRRLKRYRAYATDPSRAVILRYADRNLVITPHDPQQFIMRARTSIRTRDFPH